MMSISFLFWEFVFGFEVWLYFLSVCVENEKVVFVVVFVGIRFNLSYLCLFGKINVSLYKWFILVNYLEVVFY